MIRAAVLGSPILHSLSPTLHKRAYEILGINGTFEAIEVSASDLGSFLQTRDSSWTGFSLTMPLKEEAMKFASEISRVAAQVSSTNTLIRTPDGWSATSTDVNGFVESLHQHGYSKFESVLIIGSGATARAAAAACAQFTSSLVVVHRSAAREEFMRLAAPNIEMTFMNWTTKLPVAELVINTTPKSAADIFIDQINLPSVFFESLYNPWPTKLLQHLRAKGVFGIDGLDLLIQQGMDQIALMTGISLDRTGLAPDLRAACLAKLGK